MSHLYTLQRIGWTTNCSVCDRFTLTNTYWRDDDLLEDLCTSCQVVLHA